MPSKWNMFVKKIYHEGKSKNPHYEFKQALVDASRRKSEMNGHVSSKKHTKKHKKSKSKSMFFGGRRRRTSRRN